MDEERAKLYEILGPRRAEIQISDGEIQWWTFAGGRINSTMRHAFSVLEPEWSVIPDNLSITFRGDTLNIEQFLAARKQLTSGPNFWDDASLWHRISNCLPSYRLSKFQPLMPIWIEREVLGTYLLDSPGACRWLKRSIEHRSSCRQMP